MKYHIFSVIAISLPIILHPTCVAQTEGQARKIVARYDVTALKNMSNTLLRQRTFQREAALNAGFKVVIEKGDSSEPEKAVFAELQAITAEGAPLYYHTLNAAAAKSTRTNFLHSGGGLGLELDGEDLTLGVWDGGSARTNHKEFGDRVSIGDSDTGYNGLGSDHATHVVGTLIAKGIDNASRGMALAARAKSFHWNNDDSEVALEASMGLLISNHSYGFMLRDQFGNAILPGSYFGGYLEESRKWDETMFGAPNYLMVVAAGNDGEDHTANPSPLNGANQFDKLTGHCVAKNNLVVANARDVPVNSLGEIIGMVQIVSSSSQGPTDDLRIKPDISGNGFEVKSTLHGGPLGNNGDKYGQTGWTGTSMASPNVAGSLLLLQQLSEQKTGGFLRAATLKGLVLHTANDAGQEGPDAIFGWGLLNAKRAAETLNGNGNNSLVLEVNIQQGANYTRKFKAKGRVQVSISWTDPAGPATSESVTNSSTPVLINDLDLRVTRSGSTLLPWRLTSHASAGIGDNRVDPFERVDEPTSGDSTTEYEITVSHKGRLKHGSQDFSLIVTGDNLESQSSTVVGTPTTISNEQSIRAELKEIASQIQDIANRLKAPESQPSKTNLEALLKRLKAKVRTNNPLTDQVHFDRLSREKDIEVLQSLVDHLEREPESVWILEALKENTKVIPSYGIDPEIGTPEGRK